MRKILTYLLLVGIGVVLGLILKPREKGEIEYRTKIVFKTPEIKGGFDWKYDFTPKQSTPQKEQENDNIEKELLEQYKRANDSLKEELFKKSVTTADYEDVFTDTTQTITVKTNVTGSINSMKVDYKIFPREQVLDTVFKIPVPEEKRSLVLYAEGGARLAPLEQEVSNWLVAKAGLDYKTKKNWVFGSSYDTEKRVWLKIGKNFNF